MLKARRDCEDLSNGLPYTAQCNNGGPVRQETSDDSCKSLKMFQAPRLRSVYIVA